MTVVFGNFEEVNEMIFFPNFNLEFENWFTSCKEIAVCWKEQSKGDISDADGLSMRGMLLGYSWLKNDHRFINKRMLALENPVWREKRRLTGPEIWAAATSKVWPDSGRTSFHSSLKKTKEAPLAGCRQFSYSEKTSEKYFHTCISSSNRENSYQIVLILLELITQILSNPCWCAAVNANVTVLLRKWRKI